MRQIVNASLFAPIVLEPETFGCESLSKRGTIGEELALAHEGIERIE